jgi:NDP-sugar pyrophosphorylase family protein
MSNLNSAIILAGGKGTRISDIFPNIPKTLIEINGKSILERQIEKLIAAGVETIIISICHLADKIDDFLKNHTFSNVNIYTIRERTPLGTGGAIKNILLNTNTELAIIINGDTLNNFNYKEMISAHNSKKNENTIGVLKGNPSSSFGGLDINKNQVIRFCEKSDENLPYINVGIYILHVDVFNHTHRGSFSLEEEIFSYLKNGELSAFEYHGKFWDIGTKERFEIALKEID